MTSTAVSSLRLDGNVPLPGAPQRGLSAESNAIGGGIARVIVAVLRKWSGAMVAVVAADLTVGGVTACTMPKVSALDSPVYSTTLSDHGAKTRSPSGSIASSRGEARVLGDGLGKTSVYHGSRFDVDGGVLKGPRARPLIPRLP